MIDKTRFAAVDLGTRIDGLRRFAVWDYTSNCFWKINTHHTWATIDELLDDFTITYPGVKFSEIHYSQRDVIMMLAKDLGFE